MDKKRHIATEKQLFEKSLQALPEQKRWAKAHSAAFWVSLIYIFTIPWENAITVAGLGTLTRVIGVFMAMLWLGSALKAGFRKPHLFHKVILLFMIWNIVSLFWSVGVDETVQSIKTYVQLSIVIWVLWDLYRTPTALRAGLQAYILGVYVAVGSTLTNYLAGVPIGDYENRYAGAGLNANELALILSLGIPVAWHLATSVVIGKRNRVLKDSKSRLHTVGAFYHSADRQSDGPFHCYSGIVIYPGFIYSTQAFFSNLNFRCPDRSGVRITGSDPGIVH